MNFSRKSIALWLILTLGMLGVFAENIQSQHQASADSCLLDSATQSISDPVLLDYESDTLLLAFRPYRPTIEATLSSVVIHLAFTPHPLADPPPRRI